MTADVRPIINDGPTQESWKQMAKRKLSNGLLAPTKVRKTVWAPSEGNGCMVCGLTIARQDIEVEAHIDGSSTLRFHTRCFDAWHRASA